MPVLPFHVLPGGMGHVGSFIWTYLDSASWFWSSCREAFTSSKVKGRAQESLLTGLTHWLGDLDREMLPSASWRIQPENQIVTRWIFNSPFLKHLLVNCYLGLPVIWVAPVGQVAFLQNKISPIPHPKSTDQLKHRLQRKDRSNPRIFLLKNQHPLCGDILAHLCLQKPPSLLASPVGLKIIFWIFTKVCVWRSSPCQWLGGHFPHRQRKSRDLFSLQIQVILTGF